MPGPITGGPLPPGATTTVTTFANLLLQTGLKIGQETIVTYAGNGRSLWRYNGGGESTSTNWMLISDPRVAKLSETTKSNNTFAADAALVIDWLPIGVYDISFLASLISASATPGFKWRIVSGGTAAALTVWFLGIVRQEFFGAPFQVVNRASILAGDSYDDVTSDDVIRHEGLISVTVAGSLTVEWAQKVTDATVTTLRAGSLLEARLVT